MVTTGTTALELFTCVQEIQEDTSVDFGREGVQTRGHLVKGGLIDWVFRRVHLKLALHLLHPSHRMTCVCREWRIAHLDFI